MITDETNTSSAPRFFEKNPSISSIWAIWLVKSSYINKKCVLLLFTLKKYHSNKQSTLKGLPYLSPKVNVIYIRPTFNCVGLTTLAFINRVQMPNPWGSDPFNPIRLVQKTCLSDNHHQNNQYSSPGLLSHNLHLSLVFRAIAEEWTF